MTKVLACYSVVILFSFLVSFFISDGRSYYSIHFVTLNVSNSLYYFLLLAVISTLGCYLGEKIESLFLVGGENKKQINFVINFSFFSKKYMVLGITIIYAICFLFTIYFYGSVLLERRFYHIYENQVAESEGFAGIIGMFVAAFVTLIGVLPAFLRFITGPNSKLSWIILAISAVLLYGYATRFVAVLFFLYMIARVLDGKSDKISIKNIVLLFFASFALVLVISQREIASYGVLSVEEALLYVVNNVFDVLDTNFFGLVGSSLPSVAENYMLHDDDLKYLLIELSPQSGVASGWYDIYDLRRMSFAVPYTAIGTLAGYSIYVLFFYSLVLGIVANLFKRALIKAIGEYSLIPFYIFCVYFMGLFYTYNLRSSTRIIYYALFFVIGKIFISIRNKN